MEKKKKKRKKRTYGRAATTKRSGALRMGWRCPPSGFLPSASRFSGFSATCFHLPLSAVSYTIKENKERERERRYTK
jgi:hypothetical protein